MEISIYLLVHKVYQFLFLEPRDIIWKNIAVDAAYSKTKKRSAVVIVGLGALLWAIPVAFIQAVATADSLCMYTY